MRNGSTSRLNDDQHHRGQDDQERGQQGDAGAGADVGLGGRGSARSRRDRAAAARGALSAQGSINVQTPSYRLTPCVSTRRPYLTPFGGGEPWRRRARLPAGPLRKPIVVVSGLPRSGTSMAMKMLEAGGLPRRHRRPARGGRGQPEGLLRGRARQATCTRRRTRPGCATRAARSSRSSPSCSKSLPAEHNYQVVLHAPQPARDRRLAEQDARPRAGQAQRPPDEARGPAPGRAGARTRASS